MKQRFMILATPLMIITSISSISQIVYAEDYFNKEQFIDMIWEDWWFGEPEDGTTFPQASYERHILIEWAEENYKDFGTDFDYAVYSYEQYYENLVSEWSFKDDDEGNFYIADLDGNPIYQFIYSEGKWNMINEEGEVVDSFTPFSILDDENHDTSGQPVHTTKNNNRSNDTVDSVHRVTGIISEIKQDETTAAIEAGQSDEEEKSNYSGIFISCIIVIVVTILTGVLFLFKKNKKK